MWRLISDAGTPGISDPGFELIAAALANGAYEVVPLPGACAITTALVGSGLASDSFHYLSDFCRESPAPCAARLESPERLDAKPSWPMKAPTGWPIRSRRSPMSWAGSGASAWRAN